MIQDFDLVNSVSGFYLFIFILMCLVLGKWGENGNEAVVLYAFNGVKRG